MRFLTTFGWGTIILLHVLIALLRILYAVKGGFDLDAEEAQYWLWSKYPDWSYYSKPPLIAYINAFTTSLLGSVAWAVRLNAILLGSFLGLGVYHITRQLYSNKKLAFLVSAGLLVLPSYHYISLFFTTDVLAVLGWLFTTYFFWKAITGNRLKHWLLSGLSMGLGLLGKYTLLYFIPFSLLYLLFQKKILLLKKGYSLFLLTAAVLFLPVIIWNLNNGFLGALHVAHLAGAGREFPGWSRALIYQSEFLGGQLLLNLPLLCLLFFWKRFEIGKFLSGDFEKYVLASVGFVFLTFFFLAFYKRIRINWLLFSYFPLYIILLRAIIRSGIIYKAKSYLAVSFFLLIGLMFQPVFAGFSFPGSRIVPVQIDPFTKLMGWQQLGEFLDLEVRPHCRDNDFVILSDKYQIAAQLSFYTPGQPSTYCLPYDERRMNQYDVWGIPSEVNQNQKQVVFIKTSPLENDELQLCLIPAENITFRTQFSVQYKGQQVKTFYIYLLTEMPELQANKPVFKKY